MPFWGVQAGAASHRLTVSYILDDPFYNTLHFTTAGADFILGLQHAFPAVAAWRRPFSVTICFDRGEAPIAPALRFRAHLQRTGFIRTLKQKTGDVPRTAALIGAVHAYLWSSGPLTASDAPAAVWIPLARRIVAESAAAPGSAGARVKALLGAVDWKVITDAAGEQYSYAFLRQEMARVFSLVEERSPSLLSSAYGDLLPPPGGWGGGVSTLFVDQLKGAGISRLLLTTDGWQQVEHRPHVAARAEEDGFLFGTYDSFNSVHDPSYAGMDQSWPTAQFGGDLFERGRITGPDGKPRGGYKKIGFALSPIAARPYVESRVKQNFAAVPYSYYFVDADAYGQWYDDYTPGRMAGAADDARARADRLSWISRTFKVPVGSEGGEYLMTPVLAVAEGIFMPVIGYGGPDMNSPGSPWYLGGYYPPDGPDVFLKPVPLKPAYVHLFVDPRFRLPLYEAVFHDSVITSAHWSASALKFSNVRHTVALTQALYQAAPLFHLTPETFPADKTFVLASAGMFAATHAYTWQYPLGAFHWLTDDHMVQESVFGEMHLVANFRDTAFTWQGKRIPARSVLESMGSETRLYTP
jgi:hypothetical protein